MFVLSVLYLVPESVFNAQLVAVAGGLDRNETQLRSIELFGRTVSGIGATLLLADLILSRCNWILRSWKITLTAFTLLGLVIWPLVFFGQKWLVDHYIINPSTPAERQQAYYSQLIRSALINNAVEIEAVPFDPNQEHTPTDMTFLALFSGMIYADTQLMEYLEQHKADIIYTYVRGKAYENFDQYYGRYERLGDELRNSFVYYREGSMDYNQSLKEVPLRVREYKRQMETEIDQGWQLYLESVSNLDLQAEKYAKQIAPRIYQYFDGINKCDGRDRCIKRLDEAYEKQILQLNLGYIPPDYWLFTQARQTKDDNELLKVVRFIGRILTDPASIIEKAIDGKGGATMTTYYTDDVGHYKTRLLPKLEKRFVETGGYPSNLQQVVDFRLHPTTSKKIRKRLEMKGIYMPIDWQISDSERFEVAVTNKIKSETQRRWDISLRNQGLNMMPNKSWLAFQQDDQIQERVKQQVDPQHYIKPMLVDWNNKEFKQRVIDPRIERETNRWLRELASQLPMYADGGELAEKSRSALRASVVPPISMCLSLFLVIMTVLKLPEKAYKLYQLGLFSGKRQDRSVLSKITFRLLILVLILILPVTVLTNRYTEQDSAVHYFFSVVKEATSPIISYALIWTLNAQPKVQVLGATLEKQLDLVTRFKNNKAIFELLDQRVFEKSDYKPSSDSMPDISLEEDYPLIIHSNVEDAAIRIMNIKPAYIPGITLSPGSYEIEVSASGYKTERRWVELTPEENEFMIILSR